MCLDFFWHKKEVISYIELVELKPYRLLYICPDTSFLLTRDGIVTCCKLLDIALIKYHGVEFMNKFFQLCARKDLYIIRTGIDRKYTTVELFINNINIVSLLNN